MKWQNAFAFFLQLLKNEVVLRSCWKLLENNGLTCTHFLFTVLIEQRFTNHYLTLLLNHLKQGINSTQIDGKANKNNAILHTTQSNSENGINFSPVCSLVHRNLKNLQQILTLISNNTSLQSKNKILTNFVPKNNHNNFAQN